MPPILLGKILFKGQIAHFRVEKWLGLGEQEAGDQQKKRYQAA